MNLFQSPARLSALLLCSCLLASPRKSSAQPLPGDPRNLTGRLDNGVTWIYRPHANPPGKMSIRMHVRTGSLNESDAQRGLAHFLEHMAFNGSEHFPPGALIPYFESIGMKFGAHLNAYTSFDETVYMLDLPNTEPAQVEKALTVMSDYAFRASLLAEEIDKERGVVLEESRGGKGVQQRLRDRLWPELFAGSRFAERLPIGRDEILATAPRAEFVDYYRAYYRPENVTVVLVGDAASDAYVPLIQKWFGEYNPDGNPRAPQKADFKLFKEDRALVVTDPEMAYTHVQLLNLLPGPPPTTNVALARRELVDYLGNWIVNRRYDDRVKSGQASYRQAYAGVSDFFQEAQLVEASATGEAADWPKMLAELIAEVKRAREHGFTRRELDLARSQILASVERAARTESTRDARSLAAAIVASVNDREPFLSAQQDLELYQQLLPGIALDEVSAAFKSNFAPGTFAHVLTMPDKDRSLVPAREEYLAKAKAAWAQEVSAPQEEEAIRSLLAALPEAGRVVDRSFDPDLGITSVWLDNGVRAHHRFMDYRKDTVYLSICLAGGTIEETATNAGVTGVAALIVNEAATARHSSGQIRDFMTGKNIRVSGGSGADHFAITVTGSPLELETGLQLAHALLIDGRLEEAAFHNWKLATLQQLEQRERLPQFKAAEALEDLLSNGDPRRTYETKAQVEAQSRERAQAWFDRLRREAPIEVAVVGDIKEEDAMNLVRRYVGSLPKRPRTAGHLQPLRHSPRPPGPLERNVRVDTVTPQGVAITGFAAAEGRQTSETRALDLAQNILTSRLIKRVREELAIVYSISAQNVPSWIYTDAGRFFSRAACAPTNAAKVIQEVNAIFAGFAKTGPTDEELANAKKQFANSLDTELREPTYWFGVLRNLTLRDRNLAAEKTIRDDFQHFTAGQIREVFAKHYTEPRQFRVTALPVASEQ